MLASPEKIQHMQSVNAFALEQALKHTGANAVDDFVEDEFGNSKQVRRYTCFMGKAAVKPCYTGGMQGTVDLFKGDKGDWLFKCKACKRAGTFIDVIKMHADCDFKAALALVQKYTGIDPAGPVKPAAKPT